MLPHVRMAASLTQANVFFYQPTPHTLMRIHRCNFTWGIEGALNCTK